jgi:hypothetical protein
MLTFQIHDPGHETETTSQKIKKNYEAQLPTSLIMKEKIENQ